jgi:hypothetical protein
MKTELLPGQMVRLWQRADNIPIKARRVPEAVGSPRAYFRIVICEVPSGATCLYVASHRDAFAEAMQANQSSSGSFGFKRGVEFNLIVWGDRPVWVSSSDCELEPLS